MTQLPPGVALLTPEQRQAIIAKQSERDQIIFQQMRVAIAAQVYAQVLSVEIRQAMAKREETENPMGLQDVEYGPLQVNVGGPARLAADAADALLVALGLIVVDSPADSKVVRP